MFWTLGRNPIENTMIDTINTKTTILLIVATICIFLAVQTPALSAAATEQPDIDSRMDLSVTEGGILTVELDVDISRTYYRQPVFLSLPQLDVQQTDCLRPADLTEATHRVDSDCTELSITAHRNITADIADGTSVGYVHQNSFLLKQRLGIIPVTLSPLDTEERHSLYEQSALSTSGYYFTAEESQLATKNGFLYGGTTQIQTARHGNDTIRVVGSETESPVTEVVHGIDQHAVVPEDGDKDAVTIFIFPETDSSSPPEAANFPGESYVGLYYSGGSAVITSSAGLDTAIHEYVHSQENTYQTSTQMEWIEEAQATYYGSLSSHNASHISAYQLQARYPAYGTDANGVLNDPSQWQTGTEYQKGQAVLAGLDSCIQQQTQNRRLSDVFIQLYELDQPVTTDVFAQTVAEETGVNADLWLEAYMDTRKSPAFDDGDPSICPSTLNTKMQQNSSVSLTQVIETEHKTSVENDASSDEPDIYPGPIEIR